MTINLPTEIETRLRGEASRRGVPAEEYVIKLIEKHLPTVNERSLQELFESWEKEEKTTDSDEIVRRNEEVEQFKQAMNRNRLDMEGSDSRKPFP